MHSSIPPGSVLSSQTAGPTLSTPKENKPQLISFDSTQEFSLEHVLEVCRLVEIEDHEPEGYVFEDESLMVSQ
jgi:hypothetical protein